MNTHLSTERTKAKSRVTGLLLIGMIIFASCAISAKPPYPSKTWSKVETPEALGWSSEKLKLARQYSEATGSKAVMIIANGEILAEWGDTTRKIDVRSITKPLMNALYGIAVQEGKINIQSTLAALGVDDKEQLWFIKFLYTNRRERG